MRSDRMARQSDRRVLSRAGEHENGAVVCELVGHPAFSGQGQCAGGGRDKDRLVIGADRKVAAVVDGIEMAHDQIRKRLSVRRQGHPVKRAAFQRGDLKRVVKARDAGGRGALGRDAGGGDGGPAVEIHPAALGR